MSKEKKEQSYNEEILEFLREEERKESNHDRRYYRHNTSLEYLQKKDVPVEFDHLQADSDVEKETEVLMEFIDLINDPRLLKALKKLSESDLEVIELRYRFGFSIQEIAVKLHVNNEAAKKKHQRAIAKLKMNFEKNK